MKVFHSTCHISGVEHHFWNRIIKIHNMAGNFDLPPWTGNNVRFVFDY